MGLTTYARNQVLEDLFRSETVYLALFNDGSEVSGGGYERQEVTFSEPDDGVIENENEIRFPIATADWGEVTEGGVYDAETGGNRLDIQVIQDSNIRAVRENDQYIITEGNSTISLIGTDS